MAQASNRRMHGLQGVFIAAALVAAGCSVTADPAPGPVGSHKTTPPVNSETPDSGGGGTTVTPPAGDDDGGTTTPPAPPGMPVSADATWADGMQLTASMTIAAGVTVTIAPGATITAASGVSITVLGTLTASSSAAHAKITGTGWTGITVGSGGTLALDGVDIDGAATGLHISGGNAAAKWDNGKLTSAIPFQTDKGSTFSTDHSFVVAGGSSAIAGTFVATYLDYDKQSNEGLTLEDPAATFSAEDSNFHGAGGGDYIVSSAAAKVHLAYSIVTGSHCPFHFSQVTEFDIDHVTADANAYGSMLYQADIGPNTITHSNFGGAGALANASADIELTAPNSVLKLTEVFLGSNNSTVDGKALTNNKVPSGVANLTITTPATVAWTDAKPR